MILLFRSQISGMSPASGENQESILAATAPSAKAFCPQHICNWIVCSVSTVARFNAGFSYDWDREVSTTSPEYYKWTQWIFCQLFKRGLAYQAEVPVNWCPALGTVLANEEVIDGKSERGDHPVVRLPMKQVRTCASNFYKHAGLSCQSAALATHLTKTLVK